MFYFLFFLTNVDERKYSYFGGNFKIEVLIDLQVLSSSDFENHTLSDMAL